MSRSPRRTVSRRFARFLARVEIILGNPVLEV